MICIYHAIVIDVSVTKMLLKCHIYGIYTNQFMHTYEVSISMFMPYMNPLGSIMIRSTHTHTLLIIGICSRTNMPAIVHIYAPLHCYCSLHINSALHISVKNCIIYFDAIVKMCVSYKQVPQILQIFYISILTNMH